MFEEFKESQGYNAESLQCIEDCVRDLMNISSDGDKPGMLLGKIQSGKTRTFLGIIALAFDKGFDNVIVLTKGTNALGMQTVKRIEKEFAPFIENEQVCVYDVMQAPDLSEWIIESSKQLIVCKKEDDNLKRLNEHLFITNNGLLGKKKTLIIDDEADFGTISMRKKKGDLIAGVLWDLIDKIRKALNESAFLQVTATPYSLYLQPDNAQISGYEFQPTRPAFTHLVPIHDKYIGGDFYFRESEDISSIASDLHMLVDETEMTCLSKKDQRKVREAEVLTATSIKRLRESIVMFVMGASIRRLQTQPHSTKYSFLIHVNTAKTGHAWQEEILKWLVAALKEPKNATVTDGLFQQAYDDLKESVQKTLLTMPGYAECLALAKKLLTGLSINKVNSEGDMDKLLDNQTGELKLLNPLSIFIGGFILDRGLTIPNVIGFFYGRNPKEFQQDTVLQHARMYGARTRDDLCVTRFYTTGRVFQIMKSIHEMDSALREALGKGHKQGIVFVQRDTKNKIKPCSPNKIMLSDVLALKAHSTRVPFGFQTGYASYIKKHVEDIDKLLAFVGNDPEELPFDVVSKVLKLIRETMCFSDSEFPGDVPSEFKDEGCSWDVQSDIDAMNFANTTEMNSPNFGIVKVIVRRDRHRKRVRSSGRIENSPITGDAEGELSKQLATDCCAVIFTRQEGSKDNGWMGTPFWWPVIRFPGNLKPMIYTPKEIKI